MITLVVDGISYQYPQVDDEDWGNQATLWASSVSDVISSLRSPTLPTADAGKVRLGNGDRFSWRGFGNTFNVDLYVDVDDKLYVKIGANPPIDLTAAAGGNVTGPLSSTDNAVARYDGTTGQLIQDSVVLISDLGATSGITSLAMGGALSGVTTLAMGGTLSGATDITGSGTVQGADLVATDDLTVGDDALITGDLTVNGTTLLNGNTTIGDAAGDSLTITAATSISVSEEFANEVIEEYARPTGTSVGVRGVAISASSGSFSTTSTAYVDVTNLSVTITTTGRPVKLMLISTTTSDTSGIGPSDNDESAGGIVKFVRDSTDLVTLAFDVTAAGSGTTLIDVLIPQSCVNHLDTPGAGTYVYKLQAKAITSGTFLIRGSSLVAYEL